MDEGKTSQWMNVVKVFLNQKTDFPWSWEVSCIQPGMMLNELVHYEYRISHTNSGPKLGTHLSLLLVTAEVRNMEMATHGTAP